MTAPSATVRPELHADGPLLDVADLHTTFSTAAGTLHAVGGVSLQLARGQTLGIVGESGSGKTILTRSIMGLLPADAKVSGSVRFNGRETVDASEADRRALWGPGIALVFQDPMTSLNPVMRVGTQVIEGMRVHLGLSRSEARTRAVALLRSVGIPEPQRRMRQYPHELSGGMRQRVMIAIALACDPLLLLADEPTTALDVTVQAQILDLLASVQRGRSMAMILVTHDLGVVAGRTDAVAVMYAGRIVEYAPTRTLFANVRMPYTEALLRSIPRLDQPSHARLAAIPSRAPTLIEPPPGCAFAPRCPYAQEQCRTETPVLRSDGDPDHTFACWFPVGAVSTRTNGASS